MRMRSAAILSGHKRKLGKLKPTPRILKAYGANSIVVRYMQRAFFDGTRILRLTNFHSSLKTKASRKHGKEYSKARARFPSPEN